MAELPDPQGWCPHEAEIPASRAASQIPPANPVCRRRARGLVPAADWSPWRGGDTWAPAAQLVSVSEEGWRDPARKLRAAPGIRLWGSAPAGPSVLHSSFRAPVSRLLRRPGRRRAWNHERGLHRRWPAGLCPGAGLHGRR